MRRNLYGLAAWTSTEESALRDRLAGVQDQLGVLYDTLRQAEAQGYPEASVDRAFSEYDALWQESEDFLVEINDGSAAGTLESFSALDARIENLQRRVLDWSPFGESARKGRTSLLVYATLGSLAIAGAAAGLLYFFGRGRR